MVDISREKITEVATQHLSMVKVLQRQHQHMIHLIGVYYSADGLTNSNFTLSRATNFTTSTPAGEYSETPI